MNNNISLEALEESIKNIKSRILITTNQEQLRQLYYSLKNLVELKSIVKYNSGFVPKVKDFFGTPSSSPALELLDFCETYGCNPLTYDDKLVENYSIKGLSQQLSGIKYDNESPKVAYTKCSTSDVIDLTKGFYKSIKNPIITDRALEILGSENQFQFVKGLPKRMRFAGGVFFGDAYNNIPYLILKQNFDIRDMIIFSHEIGHALEFLLNKEKFLRKPSSAEMIPTAIELLASDYAYAQGAMSKEERDYFEKERVDVFNNSMSITSERLYEYQGLIRPEQMKREMIRSIAFRSGYELYKDLSGSKNSGDMLGQVLTSPDSFEKTLIRR